MRPSRQEVSHQAEVPHNKKIIVVTAGSPRTSSDKSFKLLLSEGNLFPKIGCCYDCHTCSLQNLEDLI